MLQGSGNRTQVHDQPCPSLGLPEEGQESLHDSERPVIIHFHRRSGLLPEWSEVFLLEGDACIVDEGIQSTVGGLNGSLETLDTLWIHNVQLMVFDVPCLNQSSREGRAEKKKKGCPKKNLTGWNRRKKKAIMEVDDGKKEEWVHA